MDIIKCKTKYDYETAKKITLAYIKWLKIDLKFQNIDKEFKTFERMYGGARGCFLYAKEKDETPGGIALREFNKDICEMKRLFVYEKFWNQGIGKRLCLELLKVAKTMGYKKMRLDTIERLKTAIVLYEKIGFYNIERYRNNPHKTARFMEIEL